MTEAATPTESPLTLEAVKERFDEWRQQPGKRRPFPNELWLEAIALQVNYKLTKILTALRISHVQLKNKQRQLMGEDQPVEKAPSSEFIAVDLEPAHQTQQPRLMGGLPSALSIELKRSDGTVLKVNELSSQAVDALITRFIA